MKKIVIVGNSMLDEPITVVPYDAEWPARAALEITRLQSMLGSEVVAWEHFGSTAVPGCEAKPIVDILIGVQGWPPSGAVRALLAEAGYEDLGEAGVAGRVYFRMREPHAFNLALTEWRSELWRTNLAVRALLRADSALLRRYSREKRAAIDAGCSHLLAYSAHKAAFMAFLVERARREHGA